MNDAPPVAKLGSIDIERIMRMLPHRYPLLLVDRVIEIEADSHAVGLKNVSINEPQFQGHFPQRPVMPGVMIVESMAQTAGVLVVYTLGPEAEGKLVYFMSIDACRFRRPIVPGDVMHVHVRKDRSRGNVWRFDCRTLVDGRLAAEAKISAMILDN
jgi:3-hydroxyacyl-[acyl-carrier-protein] dehydratase